MNLTKSISLNDLISQTLNTTEGKDEKLSEGIWLRDEFLQKDKYLSLINALEDKVIADENFASKLRSRIIAQDFGKKERVVDYKEKLSVVGVFVALFLILFSFSKGAWIGLSLMGLFGFIFYKIGIALQKLSKALHEEQSTFRQNTIDELKKVWRIYSQNNKSIYNPYIFIYFYLTKNNESEKININILDQIFRNFDFDKLKLNVNEMSELFFYHQEESSESAKKNEYKKLITERIKELEKKILKEHINRMKLNLIEEIKEKNGE